MEDKNSIIPFNDELFNLPGWIIVTLIVSVVLKFGIDEQAFLKPNVRTNLKRFSIFCSGIVYLMIVWLLFNKFAYARYDLVYVCPVNNRTECKKGVADTYEEPVGGPDEGTTTEVEGVIFKNGDYIHFSYCLTSSGDYTCYEDDSEDSAYVVEFNETVKVRKF